MAVIGLEAEDDHYNPEVPNTFGYYFVCVTYDIPHPDVNYPPCMYILGA